MAGHSEWSNIKHHKEKMDKRRAKLFSKLSRKIIRAAREGGGNPEKNVELKWAIEEARDADMPKKNIERAVKKGTGELEDDNPREAVRYEGYAPGGIAVLVEATTENRNRTHAEVNQIFKEHNGSLGEAGSVDYLFESRAKFEIPEDGYSEDQLLEIAIEAGAEEVQKENGVFELIGPSEHYRDIKSDLEEQDITIKESGIKTIPQTRLEASSEVQVEVIENLKTALLDYRDVENVYTNLKNE